MKKNRGKKELYILAAAMLLALSSLSGCKKREAVDLTGIHETEGETMEATNAAGEESDEENQAENGAETMEESKEGNAQDGEGSGESSGSSSAQALSVRSQIATETNGKVSIEYPILSNLRDSSKTDAVNELIKTQATRIINDYELDPETDTVAVTCNILSLDRSRAVFTYEGSMMTEGAAHPQALFYTTTVDLDLGTLVGFSDYADAQTMAEYILSDECRLYYPSASDEVLAELKAMDKTALTDILKSCDFTSVSEGTFPQSFSYENQGDIYMVLPVSHALGDYAIVRYTPDTK